MKKLSLKMRLTVMNVLLLLLCCLGLTLVLNYAAGNMADSIETAVFMPAKVVYTEESASVQNEIGESAVPPQFSANTYQARTLFKLKSCRYLLLIVAAGGLLTWMMTGRALHPLKKLSEEMQNQTVQKLSEELPVPESHDETASLTRSFNEMNRRLDKAFSMQKRFSQSAAHELRTPLTVLKAKVDVFSKTEVHTPEEYRELLNLVKNQTQRMTDLVNDLLGLVNLDDLQCDQPVSALPLLEDAVEELSALAEANRVCLELNAQDCVITGNANLLYRVFVNLIENSIKYNHPGGSVLISTALSEQELCIEIADTGPGIPEEQKALIFEPFYRVDKSRSRAMGGAGLGLATVQAILEKHRGSISVADRPGGGSVFTVRLPLAD